LTLKTPLLVIVARRGNEDDSAAYAGVLRDTFVGTQVPAVGSSAKELLQAAELREFRFGEHPVSIPPELAGSADRILVIVLDTRAQNLPFAALDSSSNQPFNDSEQQLFDVLRMAGHSDKNFVILNVFLTAPGSLFGQSSNNNQVVRLGLLDLQERDLRLPFIGLYALHNAIRLFTPPDTSGSGAKPGRLFFSHAKRDGVPLTTAVVNWMQNLKGFEAFYETTNLDLDQDIDKQLETAIRSAIVIVFRTDVFDLRYWCQKEVLWAEEHGRPVITVDARWQIEHSPSVVSYDSTPVVRIPDGNLVRVFAAAFVEALRVELFNARAQVYGGQVRTASMASIPRAPSLISLYKACTTLNQQGQPRRFVVYPNPSLPSGMRAATEGLARGVAAGCSVLSLDEFRLVI
jgi:hypothetical protein